jgi:hypothetical protein
MRTGMLAAPNRGCSVLASVALLTLREQAAASSLARGRCEDREIPGAQRDPAGQGMLRGAADTRRLTQAFLAAALRYLT